MRSGNHGWNWIALVMFFGVPVASFCLGICGLQAIKVIARTTSDVAAPPFVSPYRYAEILTTANRRRGVVEVDYGGRRHAFLVVVDSVPGIAIAKIGDYPIPETPADPPR